MKRQATENDARVGSLQVRLRRLAVASAVLTLLVAGVNVWMTISARPLILHELSAVPTNSVGLLLGVDRVLRDGSTNLHFAARTQSAANLILSGKVSRLLVSGHPDNRGFNEPKEMAAELV